MLEIYSDDYTDARSSTLPQNVDCLIVTAPANYDSKDLLHSLNRDFPNAQKHIATTCRGYLNQNQVHIDRTVGIYGFKDSWGSYGTAAGPLSDEKAVIDTVNLLLETASLRADRSGELPSLVWMSSTPGYEELIIEAIQSFYQTKVLICGGSAADEAIEGKWWVSDQYQSYSCGLVLTVLYPSSKIFTRLSSGYFLTECSGIITKCSRRSIMEIDHQPAADIYNQWNHQQFDRFLNGGTILAESTYMPLATEKGHLGSLSYFQVIHPKDITEDRSMSTFADVKLDQRIYLLKGDEESVVGRAKRVIKGAMLDSEHPLEKIKGALMIFCAGCFLAIEDRAEEIRRGVTNEIPNIPLLCQFTFGEQGVFPQGECVHGNLMISVVLFVD